MFANFSRQPARTFVLIGLLLALLAFAGSVSAQDMVQYPDNPIYGLSSGINATVDVYLPSAAHDLNSDRWMLSQELVHLPAVFFIPALSPPVMEQYAADLTGQGYAVVALDYRLQSAARDSLCGLSWLHTFAPIYGIDENRIVAFGFGYGGELAALLGAMGTTNQLVSADQGRSPMLTAPGMNPAQLADCPWPVPDVPMIEGVATYDALLDTQIALRDEAVRLSKLPPSGVTRAEMIAAFDEFAAMPVANWHEYRLPEVGPVEVSMADILRERIPQAEVIASQGVPVAEVLREQFAPQDTVRPVELTNEQLSTLAQSLPPYWLDGNEPPHLLMVAEGALGITRADNLAYNDLLRELGVPVRWAEMEGCGHDQCAMLEHMQPLNLFLDEVFASS
jgi:acetyl esterase/lipase